MMNLGTETGSLINHVLSRYNASPVVGCGATFLGWTDRSPATVVEVFTRGAFEYIGLKADDYKRIDNNGMSENQEYVYMPNNENPTVYYRRKVGTAKWAGCYQDKETGRWKNSGSGSIVVGQRERYYDYCF